MAHPTPRRRRGPAALVCTAALALAGCSSDGGIVATYDTADADDAAMLSGTLSIGEDCVTVAADDGVTTPAFDGGVEVSGGVLRFHGAEYTDGAKIELGGDEATDPSAVRLPRGCPAERVFLVAAR